MDYKKIFNKFIGLNILIIGDVMIDSYMWGKVDRISPEAPVPIATISSVEDRLGGAANVALNIRAMGANPILCSVVGSDPKSKLLLSLMKKLDMDNTGIYFSKSRPTTVKTRIIGNQVQMLRVDEEISDPLKENDEINFIKTIKEIIETNQKPILAHASLDAPAFVELIFANPFEAGTISTLSIAEIVTNCMGIAVEPNTTASFIIPGEVVENDIVINEILADESPVIGLPEWEFVELYNASDSDIELKDWLFVIGTTSKTFDSYILESGSYLILCNNNAVEAYSQYGDVIGFSSFQITNSGTSLSLVNNHGIAVSTVTFSNSWYNDSEKDNIFIIVLITSIIALALGILISYFINKKSKKLF